MIRSLSKKMDDAKRLFKEGKFYECFFLVIEDEFVFEEFEKLTYLYQLFDQPCFEPDILPRLRDISLVAPASLVSLVAPASLASLVAPASLAKYALFCYLIHKTTKDDDDDTNCYHLCKEAANDGCLNACACFISDEIADFKSRYPEIKDYYSSKEIDEIKTKISKYLEKPLKLGLYYATSVLSDWLLYLEDDEELIRRFKTFSEIRGERACCRIMELNTESNSQRVSRIISIILKDVGINKNNCSSCAREFINVALDNKVAPNINDIDTLLYSFHLVGIKKSSKYVEEFDNDQSEDDDDDQGQGQDQKKFVQAYNASLRRRWFRKIKKFYRKYKSFIDFDGEYYKMLTLLNTNIGRSKKVAWARDIIGFLSTDDEIITASATNCFALNHGRGYLKTKRTMFNDLFLSNESSSSSCQKQILPNDLISIIFDYLYAF
jgi:hypothetical protein